MTNKSIPYKERAIIGKGKIIVPLQYYEMDYSHTYIFIPKDCEKRVDDILHCVFGVQTEDYRIFIVNSTSSHSNHL